MIRRVLDFNLTLQGWGDSTVTSTSSWLYDRGLGCCVGHAVMAGDT
jgi:hypothetical protein